MGDNDLREQFSDVQHDIWSHWMRWMFKTGTVNIDGSWTMPATLVMRWQGQMETPYYYLTEREKESDREQADKVLAVPAVVHLLSDVETLRNYILICADKFGGMNMPIDPEDTGLMKAIYPEAE